MIDRSEGDGDRFAAFIRDCEGDDLGAGRAEFASKVFVSGTDHDIGSFGGESISASPKAKTTSWRRSPAGRSSPGAGCTVAMRVVGMSVSPRRGSRTPTKSAPTAMIGPVTRWPARVRTMTGRPRSARSRRTPPRVASSVATFSSQRRRERARAASSTWPSATHRCRAASGSSDVRSTGRSGG